jgi:excinuclease ABC subunit C
MQYKIRKIEHILSHLPDKPGVYQFFDEKGRLLYVGKAKKLSNRVRSYFNGKNEGKTKILVQKISDIKYTVVGSEQDALLLENNLIKENQPPYNIRLKDDKTYPWICITDEPFPRVLKVRNRDTVKGSFFGPYPNARFVNILVGFLSKQFKIRTCSLDLSASRIASGKYDSCLEYQIGNCKAPCVGLQEESDYLSQVDRVSAILKGKTKEVIEELKVIRDEFSQGLEFERAHSIQKSIDDLNEFSFKSTVVSPSVSGYDVICYIKQGEKYYYSFFRVSNGAIISTKNGSVLSEIEANYQYILNYILDVIYEEIGFMSNTVLLDEGLILEQEKYLYEVPKIGDKRKLVELCKRNAFLYAKSKEVKYEEIGSDQYQALIELSRILGLSGPPLHMECFDNSNIQGTDPSSACVVFKNGVPSKKDYRHFGIKTVIGPDDFGSMKEVVYRRYSGLIDRNEGLPDLIIIDGGKGQLSAALTSLNELKLKIPIVGIAKRIEELFVPGDKDSIILSKRSSALKVIQHMRNEAHRFSLRLHRNKRSHRAIQSELDNIPGIGKESKKLLLTEFGSISSIRNADIVKLIMVIGKRRAKIVFDYFNR